MEHIIESLAEYTGIPKEKITKDSELIADLQLSSIDMLTLIAQFEEEHNTRIPDEAVIQCYTVGDIYNELCRCMQNTAE
ncbi:MAG TPA: acyl carrier protein [Ruminococcus sp.]|nr:acyl carrier protein [Ruminococcus sp.]